VSKPRLSIAVLGQIDDGKTTLTQALVARHRHRNKVVPAPRSYQEIARAQTSRWLPQPSECETASRCYQLTDLPGHADYVKGLLAGAVRPDGAILVVAADAGTMPQTREHLLLARQVGVLHLVVFLGKCDLVADDPSFADLAEWDVRDLLSQFDYPGDDVAVIRGNARAALDTRGVDAAACACLDELMDALDHRIPLPEPLADRPFLLPVEDVFSATRARGTVATGRIERGKVKAGDEVDIVGLLQTPRKATVIGVETFGRIVDVAEAGLNAGLLLSGVQREEVERGQVLAAPGSVRQHTRFEAHVYLLTREEGGRHTPLVAGSRPQFLLRTSTVSGALTLPEDVASIMPGDYVEVAVQLQPDSAVALEEGLYFGIREGGRNVGCGVITRVVPEA
jgi:elongation factor Tu